MTKVLGDFVRVLFGMVAGLALLLVMLYGAGALVGWFWVGVCSVARC